MKVCSKCAVELVVGVTWYACQNKIGVRLCKACHVQRTTKYKQEHPEMHRATSTTYNRKNGHKPMPRRFEGTDFYVYCLYDKHNSVAYLGSGKNDRVNDHLREVRSLLRRGISTYRGQSVWNRKRVMIREVLDTPQGYRYEKLATGLTKQQSLEVESFYIEVFGLDFLTNEAAAYNRGTARIPEFEPISMERVA